MTISSERTAWAAGLGLPEEIVEQLTVVREQARARGFTGHLSERDIWAGWPIELEAAGLGDLADRVWEIEAEYEAAS